MRCALLRRRPGAAVVMAATALAGAFAAFLAPLALAACTGDDPAPAPAATPRVSAPRVWDSDGFGASGAQLPGAAGWDGEHHVLVWQHMDAFPGPPERGRVVVRRVRSDGSFVDSAPIVLAPATFWRAPGMACRPGVCLVAWADGAAVRARFWSAAGEAGPPFDVTDVEGSDGDVQVSAAAEGWAVTWQRAGALVTRRLDVDGDALDPAPVAVITSPAAGLAVACAASGCLYVVTTVESPEASTLHVVRRLPDGTTHPVVVTPLPFLASYTTMATDGTRWLLATGDRSMFLDPEALVPGAATSLDTGNRPWDAAARLDGGWWLASLGAVVRLDDAGARTTRVQELPGNVLLSGPRPMLSWNGEAGLVASSLNRGNVSGLLASRLAPSGDDPLLGPASFEASRATEAQQDPFLAATPGGFLVGWREQRAAFDSPALAMRFVSDDGVPLSPLGLPLMPLSGPPGGLFAATAVDDGHHVVVAAGTQLLEVDVDTQDVQSHASGTEIHALRCVARRCLVGLPSGLRLLAWPEGLFALASQPPLLTPASARPVLADDGQRFAVGWVDSTGVHVLVIDGQGRPGPSLDLAAAPASAGLALVGQPEGFAVFWNDGEALWTARLDGAGAVAGPPRRMAATGSALDGAGNLIAADLGDAVRGDLVLAGGADGLAVAAVAETTALFGPVLAPTMGIHAQATRLAAATAPSGRTLVVWSAPEPGDAAQTPRLHGVVVEP